MVTIKELNEETADRQAFLIDLFDDFDNSLTINVSLINSYELANEDFPIPDKLYRLVFEDYVSYQVHNRRDLEITTPYAEMIHQVEDEARDDILINLIGEKEDELLVYELNLENHFLEIVCQIEPSIEEIEMEFESEMELLN